MQSPQTFRHGGDVVALKAQSLAGYRGGYRGGGGGGGGLGVATPPFVQIPFFCTQFSVGGFGVYNPLFCS